MRHPDAQWPGLTSSLYLLFHTIDFSTSSDSIPSTFDVKPKRGRTKGWLAFWLVKLPVRRTQSMFLGKLVVGSFRMDSCYLRVPKVREETPPRTSLRKCRGSISGRCRSVQNAERKMQSVRAKQGDRKVPERERAEGHLFVGLQSLRELLSMAGWCSS